MFAEAFAEGFLSIAPAIMAASRTRTAIILRKLAMDCVALAKYRPRNEAGFNKQALYLMNMPRVQVEIDKIMSRHGMSKDRMAARLAEIMEGKATTETLKYEHGVLKEKIVQTNSIADSLRAIDISIRATTGYAPTNAKITVNNEMTAMFDAQTFEQTPEIAVDPTLAIEAKPEQEEPDENEDGDEEYDEENYCDACDAAGKEECDCEYDDEDEE